MATELHLPAFLSSSTPTVHLKQTLRQTSLHLLPSSSPPSSSLSPLSLPRSEKERRNQTRCLAALLLLLLLLFQIRFLPRDRSQLLGRIWISTCTETKEEAIINTSQLLQDRERFQPTPITNELNLLLLLLFLPHPPPRPLPTTQTNTPELNLRQLIETQLRSPLYTLPPPISLQASTPLASNLLLSLSSIANTPILLLPRPRPSTSLHTSLTILTIPSTFCPPPPPPRRPPSSQARTREEEDRTRSVTSHILLSLLNLNLPLPSQITYERLRTLPQTPRIERWPTSPVVLLRLSWERVREQEEVEVVLDFSSSEGRIPEKTREQYL